MKMEQINAQKVVKKQLLPRAPNHKFFLRWHPRNVHFAWMEFRVGEPDADGNFEIVEKLVCLPYIDLIRHQPGINNMTQTHPHKAPEVADPRPFKGKLEDQGVIVIDSALEPEYMGKLPTTSNGRPRYVQIWNKHNVLHGDVFTEMDHFARNRWIISLFAREKIPDMHVHYIEKHIKMQKGEAEFRRGKTDDRSKELVVSYDKKILAMEEFLTEYKRIGNGIFNQLASFSDVDPKSRDMRSEVKKSLDAEKAEAIEVAKAEVIREAKIKEEAEEARLEAEAKKEEEAEAKTKAEAKHKKKKEDEIAKAVAKATRETEAKIRAESKAKAKEEAGK